MDRDIAFANEVFEDLLRDVRFENPHRPLRPVDRRGSLPLVAVRFARLPFPGVVAVVVLPDAMIKLPREAPDHALVSGVGPTESACGETAQMRLGADNDDRFAQPLRLNRCDNARGRATVDDNVGLLSLGTERDE